MPNVFIQGLNKLSKITDMTAIITNTIGTLMVLCLVVVVDYDVIARGAFNKPFAGAVEVVQFTMVLIVFLQLPDVVRVDRLTRSDGFLAIMQPRFPKVSMWIRRFINGLSAMLMALIAIAMWPEFIEMLETKDYFGVPGVFVAPWWPIKLVIFLSAGLCSLIFILKVLLATTNI
ncbi:TRAP transporter small permease [Marinomonas sp.]|nr:TRAP transporter small permease [Marinomonas sp.]MDB4838043.1 TRAP transporter small permease [Marinomonas sp.]